LPTRIVAQKFKLRFLRIGIVLRSIDLGGCEIAARFQFFGIELCDRLAGVQLIAFLREYLFDSPAHSRSNMHLVDFDRAGDGIGIAATADECRREYERDHWPQNGRNLQNAASLAITRREVEGDAMAGYSGTPLVRKLGIKPGEQIVAINAPKNYAQLLAGLPNGAQINSKVNEGVRFVHLFTGRRAELTRHLNRLRTSLDDAGTLWISWPKKSSGVPTDVTEDVIRAEALPLGFVDVKVCAVDETWSGLKLMVRRTNRAAAK
jgi:hypothetical protein